MREDGAGEQWREGGTNWRRGKELCNDQVRKTREKRSESERQMEPGTKSPIAGVAFTTGKHTLSKGN